MPLRFFPLRLALAVLAAFASIGLRAQDGATSPPLIVISLDAFRWDYCALHPAETPHLRQLASEGISASDLIPVYPSNTFPNHYAIATGLYPAHHGIINNDFFDPTLGAFYHYNVSSISRQSRWWGGEPIWITAVKQGLLSACSVWPGSEPVIEGLRPTYIVPFTNLADVHNEKRLDTLMGWLTAPIDRRPSLVMFYLEEANATGHKFGPDSAEMVATIKLLDHRIGLLMDDLKAARIDANLIIVSDHGMTNVSPQRVLIPDDYVDPSAAQIDFHNPIAGFRPLKGTAEDLFRALSRMPHARAYLTKNVPASFWSAEFWNRLFHPSDYLPERFHLSDNPRIPPVLVIPDEGWEIEPRAYFNTYRLIHSKGDHGYDPVYKTMHGILIAHGPAFRTGGEVIGPVENVNIYNLMCAVLHLKPAPNDGDDRLVKEMLR